MSVPRKKLVLIWEKLAGAVESAVPILCPFLHLRVRRPASGPRLRYNTCGRIVRYRSPHPGASRAAVDIKRIKIKKLRRKGNAMKKVTR